MVQWNEPGMDKLRETRVRQMHWQETAHEFRPPIRETKNQIDRVSPSLAQVSASGGSSQTLGATAMAQ